MINVFDILKTKPEYELLWSDAYGPVRLVFPNKSNYELDYWEIPGIEVRDQTGEVRFHNIYGQLSDAYISAPVSLWPSESNKSWEL